MERIAFLSLGEVCQRLGVSRATLWRMMHRGDFPKPVQLSLGRVGVPVDEFDDWQRTKREQRTAAPRRGEKRQRCDGGLSHCAKETTQSSHPAVLNGEPAA